MLAGVIRAAYGAGDPEAEYLVEVARRIDTLFPGGLADVAEGLAHALEVLTVVCPDGFVINDPLDLGRTIGIVEAVLVVAALDRAERAPDWWDRQRFAGWSGEDLDRRYASLPARLAALGRVGTP